MNPALGMPILAAVLEQAGHQAQVHDLEALRVMPQQLVASFDRQREQWPDAIGFTCTTHNQRGVRECIEALRGVGYEGYINVGGPHVTMLANTANLDEQSSWGADAWVIGECEGNIADIFGHRRTGLIEGKRMPIEDIPGPLWSNHAPFPMTYYGNMPKIGHPEGIAMWSRGCPHNCIFCANPVFKHQRTRSRPVERVYADMEMLRHMGAKAVFVYDDELVGHGGKQNGWLSKVCERIAPLGLLWKCQGRCSERNVTREVLQAMYDAGCRAIMWGVESFSDRVLKAMRKGTTEADIWHTLRLAHDVGIGNWLFFMVGNYQETARDLQYTAQQLTKATQEGLAQWRQVTVCTPVPGTELHRLAAEEGWLVESPESGPQMNQVYTGTPWISKREMRYWQAKLRGTGP